MQLTRMQRRYIWLAGSFPRFGIVQGRGARTPRLCYKVTGRAILIFGYSNPLHFLVRRGFFQPHNTVRINAYMLTETGKAAFDKIVARGGMPDTDFRRVE